MAKKVKALVVKLTSDTGALNTDNVTSDGSVSITPISNGDTISYRMSSDGGATWSDWSVWDTRVSGPIPSPAEDGAWLVEVLEAKKNGTLVDTASLTFTLDRQAAAPVVALTEDTGGSSSDGITHNGALNVSGLEPGATAEYSTDAGATWSGSFAAVEGENNVLVRQTDLAGNVSTSGSLIFTLDDVAPVTQDDHFALDLTVDTSITTANVLGNDSDAGGALTAANITKVDPAANGSVLNNGDGTFTYTPDAGFTGPDWFNYIVTDAAGNSSHGTVTIDVNAGSPSGNHPPMVDAPLKAWAPLGSAPIAVYAFQNAWDADGDPLTVVDLPGTLPTGVTYDPGTQSFTFDPGQASSATLSYGVSDGLATTPTSVTFVASASPFIPYDPQTGELQSLIDAIVPGASGIQVDPETITLTAGPTSVNFYNGSLTPLGIGPGLLITSGTTPPPLNTLTWFGEDNSMPGNPALDAVVNTVFHTQPNSYDATMLSFSFEVSDATSTSVAFDLVFGSDEYPEWVDQYVDCAIVLVNGVNVALFGHDPANLLPLSVITPNLDAGYFIDNGDGHLPIEYDGISHPLKIVAPVHPGANTITIGVGDTGDHIYDSGLFIANLTASDAPGSGVVIPFPIPTPPPGGGSDVTGTAQDEYFETGDGDDTIHCGAGDDIVVANGGDDSVFGEDDNDAINGGDGNDSLVGGNGEDELAGGSGQDTVDGGAGPDELSGGSGQDVLTGGADADIFKYKSIENWASGGIDTITDFGDGGSGNTVALSNVLDLHDAGINGDVLLFSAAQLTGAAGYVPDPDWMMPSVETYSTVAATALVNGSAATEAHAQFVYNSATGILSYDADGTGGGTAVDIVILGQVSHPTSLVETDLVVYG